MFQSHASRRRPWLVAAMLAASTLLGACTVVPPRYGSTTVTYVSPAPRVYYGSSWDSPGYYGPPRHYFYDWGYSPRPHWGRPGW